MVSDLVTPESSSTETHGPGASPQLQASGGLQLVRYQLQVLGQDYGSVPHLDSLNITTNISCLDS